MAKAKTSGKRKSSSKKSKEVVLHPHKVLDESILDRETLKSILMEALIDGDIETLKDVLITQIRIANKAELVRKSKLGRQTLYDLIEGKREFNPTIKTLSSLLKAIAA
jgi:DNA-binding phage protein